MKVKPTRKCLVSGEIKNKEDLFRVVRTPEKEVVLDMTGKLNGRGAYVSKNAKIIEKARKSGILSKILEVEVPDTIYDRMLLILKMK